MSSGGGRRAKLAGAVGLLARDPRELFEVAVDQSERAVDRFRARPSWRPQPVAEVAAGVDAALGTEVARFLDEDGLTEIDGQVRERVERLGGSELPFPLAHNAAPSLARVCYALCRALRPAVVLETGVAYGVSSSFITKALELNGARRAPQRRPRSGAAGRRELHRRARAGRAAPALDPPSRHEPPPPAASAPTARRDRPLHPRQPAHVPQRELGAPNRRPPASRPAAVVVDDAAGNRAFEDWAERSRPSFAAVVAEEPVGVAVVGREI